MRNKCPVCGMITKFHLIPCGRCGKPVCLHCISSGRCSNCIVDEYNEQYKEKVEKYAKAV